MKFYCDPSIYTMMHRRRRYHLAVEVAETNHSDIEVTELYTRLVSDHFAQYLVEKKGYRLYPMNVLASEPSFTSEQHDAGEKHEAFVLLPNHRMHIDEVVTFRREKLFLFIHRIIIEGIRL